MAHYSTEPPCVGWDTVLFNLFQKGIIHHVLSVSKLVAALASFFRWTTVHLMVSLVLEMSQPASVSNESAISGRVELW